MQATWARTCRGRKVTSLAAWRPPSEISREATALMVFGTTDALRLTFGITGSQATCPCCQRPGMRTGFQLTEVGRARLDQLRRQRAAREK